MDIPYSPSFEQNPKNISSIPTSPLSLPISTTYTLPYDESPSCNARSSIYALKDRFVAKIKEKHAKLPNLIYQKEK
jgi:hypothetical protein